MRYSGVPKKELKKAEISLCVMLFWIFILSASQAVAQSGEEMVKKLAGMGFENVGFTEDEGERVYVLQNSTWRLQGVGIGKAVDAIQQEGLPKGKNCRIIVLENNVPQISLSYTPLTANPTDSAATVRRQDWEVSYELDGAWKKVRKVAKTNSSLFKVDIVLYPRFMFQNYKLSKMYDIVLNLSPAIEVSLWRGMKFTGQVIFPVVNDNYGRLYNDIRPGYVTLSQSIRLPGRIFLKGIAGIYEDQRAGFELQAKYVLPDEHFWLTARLGYTCRGYWENWAYSHGKQWATNGHVGIHYYWTKYNTQFSLKGERFLASDHAIGVEMYRHFRYSSIGFYAVKVMDKKDAANQGLNGGFAFQIALPPYKQKRKGYIPRVVGGEFGIRYNAGNDSRYGQRYRTSPDDNFLKENSLNSYFIKSELLNF